MLEALKAALLGVLQGATEFLPVSSSGHLILLEHVLSLKPDLAFNVVLHVGTLVAVFFYFRQEIMEALKDVKLLIRILVLTAVTALLAFPLKKLHLLESFHVLKVTFPLTLVSLILIQWLLRRPSSKTFKELTYIDAVVVGLFQGIAVLPGISRSGATILASLLMGFAPEEAFKVSFVASIPAILGAFLLELKDLHISHGLTSPLSLTLGFTFSLLVGLLSLFLLEKLLKVKSFWPFVVWLSAVSVLVFVLN